jgi:hypothetical protein
MRLKCAYTDGVKVRKDRETRESAYRAIIRASDKKR